MNHCKKELKAKGDIRVIFRIAVLFCLIGICTQPILAQFSNETDLEFMDEVTFELPGHDWTGQELFTQGAIKLSFEQRRNRKAIGCLLLVSGTLMKIQSRSIYNDYLEELNMDASQALYKQANGLHKASLVSMGLGSIVFVIPIGKK